MTMQSKDFPSPLYSELGIEYQQAYDGPYSDLSYSCNGTTVIAALKDGKITGFGSPVLAIGRKLKQAAEQLSQICDNIWYRTYEIDDFAKLLLEKGYKATPYFTQVIDLSKTEAELHADIRKSYKSLIHKADIYGWPDAFGRFKQMHLKAAGYQTRSDKTWGLQFAQIQAGEAFLIMNEGSAAFFIYNNHTCYYGVGCSVEGAGSHAAIWKAILHAKTLGCKYFEMGEQVFSSDEKLMNISKFKRGFGGKTLMRLDLRKKE